MLDYLRKMFSGVKVKALNSDRLQTYVTKRLGEDVCRKLDCLHRMMVLGSQQTPPLVGRIQHFPKLVEDNVREGLFEHEDFLPQRGAAPNYLKVAMTIAYYTGMRKGRELVLMDFGGTKSILKKGVFA
jgi:hypothetical protein